MYNNYFYSQVSVSGDYSLQKLLLKLKLLLFIEIKYNTGLNIIRKNFNNYNKLAFNTHILLFI